MLKSDRSTSIMGGVAGRFIKAGKNPLGLLKRDMAALSLC
jgi:hypothetical protein